ncbi:hypothetical protein HYV72_02275, partial [Candidatus Uhrbacteria bacterium]|nr:hypothetical protein [Candidatus Uhrbacteria bacterium]
NFDQKEHGPVTVRTALQGSLNIPAVKALHIVGVEKFLDFLERFGYSTFKDRSRFGLSVVLGGGEVTLLDHTSGYATLAAEGVLHEPVSVLKVESPSAEVLYEWKETEGTRVLDANIARMVSNVLSDDASRQYIFGAGSLLQLGGRPIAAKTGTTNDYRDGWTLGYTPSVAVGVWGGNNDNTAMSRGAGGSTVAAPIWNAVMRRYLEGKPVEAFGEPTIPVLGKAALDGGVGQGQTVTIDRVSGKLATEYTPLRLRENKTFVTHHSLLYYVDRTNPTGPSPGVDSMDPMFASWESGVAAWVAKQEKAQGTLFVNEEPPTEYDDVHTSQNVPDVTIESPTSGDLEVRSITVQVRVRAPREVNRVEYYIDGYYLAQTSTAPYQMTVNIPAFVASGEHSLHVIAFDDVENEGRASMRIRVPEGTTSDIQVLDPRAGQTIVAASPTYTIGLQIGEPTRYSRIDVYLSPRVGAGQQLVGSVVSPSKAIESVGWTLPMPGEYVLSVIGFLSTTGEEIQGGSMVIEVEAPSATTVPSPGVTTGVDPTLQG